MKSLVIPYFFWGEYMIQKQKISSFDPFNMSAFRCPVCGGQHFTELYPYGGVWCDECNARFDLSDTCDGLRKIAVRCTTEHLYTSYKEKALSRYCTTIWADDTKITWLSRGKDGKIVTVDPTPY